MKALVLEENGKLAGMIAVADVIKPESPEAVQQLKNMGIHVVMLTGDNERTAQAIGRQVGVSEVVAGVLPDGKEAVISRLKEFGKAADKAENGIIDGVTVFHLYDTYGFPVEITEELATERGLKIDKEGYEKSFAEHQSKSKAGAEGKFAAGLADHQEETVKLHTATHLLQAALQKVLPDEDIKQKGSNITAERLRFDFSCSRPVTKEEQKQVEDLVNEVIAQDLPVVMEEMPMAEARERGYFGVFESKYGERVKTYTIGDFSKELCGGPHVEHTGVLGTFKIKKEQSSSSGVRRIKAVLIPKE